MSATESGATSRTTLPSIPTLFPRAIDPANVRQRLKQLIKAIDPHPLVIEMGRMNGVAWTVS